MKSGECVVYGRSGEKAFVSRGLDACKGGFPRLAPILVAIYDLANELPAAGAAVAQSWLVTCELGSSG